MLDVCSSSTYWIPPGWLLAVLLLFVLGGTPLRTAQAQMERKRADVETPVSDVFWTQTVVTMSSTRPLSKGTLNATILHTFGRLRGGIQSFFGLDAGANIRLGVDYGVTDWLSLGVGRTRYEKVYDGRFKAHLSRQHTDGSPPLDVALRGGISIRTDEANLETADRLSYLSAFLLSRKVTDRWSLQLMPMVSHFNVGYTIRSDGQLQQDRHTHVALGVGTQLGLSDRVALTAEYLPVLGARSDGTTNAAAVGLNVWTGGHVFQMFLATSQWHLEQFRVARNQDSVLEGDFRFGFNVNRLFQLGGKKSPDRQ